MFDLITIGDIKLDAFISLDRCKDKCDLRLKKIEFAFGEKISVDLLSQQIAGSAPNVATALSRMGKHTAIISHMGDDQTRDHAMDILKKEQVETDFVASYRRTSSAYSTVLSLQGEKTILVSYLHKILKLPHPFPKTKWIYLCEMGNAYEKTYRQLLRELKKDHVLLGYNPGNEQIRDRKPELFDMIARANVLFVNVEEAQRIVGNTRLKVKHLAEALFAMGPSEVVITDGKNGSYGYNGTCLFFCPVFPGERIESTGAGDSFASAYIGANMNGGSMQEALRWGSVNAASVVHEIGPTQGLLTQKQIQKRLRTATDFTVSMIAE
ncbi:carbohydrate kinase family protein [Candidatus Uhrbacteria bacterium]|nr:carbohydrate kinase family protein [Candidatus Uhrbacteria bacterium]